MKDKKIIILSIVGVLMLVSIVVATSYAYFTANVSGNKDTNNVVITNGVMALEYSDGDEITLANATPGSSVTKTFTVKNTGNVSTNYTIYFSELSNKFVDKTDLIYTLTSSDGGKNVAQTQVPSTNEAMVSNYAIDAGKTHTYTLTITFLDKDENQDDNQNVSFSTKVSVNETKEYVPVFAEQIADLAKTDTTNFATDDPDNNIRYIGANPNNYVYFNCSDYSNQSDSTCEKWRIIGVFKNMTKEDGSKADLVKIVKDESIGYLPYDLLWGDNRNLIYQNDWSKSSLSKLLENNYYNSKLGMYYLYDEAKPIDFSNTGIKNETTRQAIAEVKWNLGGVENAGFSSENLYDFERGEDKYNDNETSWIGKIGLMYPSDYGYSISGSDEGKSRYDCLNSPIGAYNSLIGCGDTSWMKFYNTFWMLTPNSTSNDHAFILPHDSYLQPYATLTDQSVYPVVYVNNGISLKNIGNGNKANPYQLQLENINEPEVTDTKITMLGKEISSSQTFDDDPDNNVRYVGENPDNYVYFNCSDYNNQNDSTCEKWRIIGLFKNVTKADGASSNLVKIIKNDSIGDYLWDYRNENNKNYYTNNWSTSSLNKLLNQTYYNNTSGTYSNYGQDVVIDLNGKGLKNSTTKQMIAEVVWNIGSISPDSNDASRIYKLEHRDTTTGSNPLKWTGKISLASVSDILYASGNTENANHYSCAATYLRDYMSRDNDVINECLNNYLYHNISSLIGANTDDESMTIFYLQNSNGKRTISTYGVTSKFATYPSLFLSNDVVIISGNGTSDNPYQLGLK